MKKISILGYGWLGSKLALLLTQEQYVVKASTQHGKVKFENTSSKIEMSLIYIGESIPLSIVENDFFNCEVLIVSLKPTRSSNDHGFFVNQIKVVAELAKANGVKQLIFLSSTSVYGEHNQIVSEDSLLNPTRQGGISLAQAETILQSTEGFNTVILRLGGLIGPGRTPIEVVAEHRKTGSLYVPVNLVHSDDVVFIVQQIIEKQIKNEVFNIVTDSHPLRVQYYQQAFHALKKEPEPFSLKQKANFKFVDNRKIKQALNYTFRLSDPVQIYNYEPVLPNLYR